MGRTPETPALAEATSDRLARQCEIAAWLIAAALLPAILMLHLLPALLAGLLVFQLVHIVAPLLQRRLSSERAKLVAVALLAATMVGVVAGLLVAAVTFFRSDAGNLPALFQKMAEIIENSRANMPPWLLQHLPDYGANGDNVKDAVVHWLRDHAAEVKLVGAQAGRGAAHVVIGMIIGAIISLSEARSLLEVRPLQRALTERAYRLAESFRRVVFAQVRISAINTTFTAIYLVVLLPLFGVELPYTTALIVITFIVGLLPVIGNLISNTFIVVVSLAHSPAVAVSSLAFLIVIHKLEYFLNAKIIGTRIRAHAWELLLAMLFMEAAFGLGGVVAAPIYYAYLKDELGHRGLV
jgi:predicted PurR-regulated permease PerM